MKNLSDLLVESTTEYNKLAGDFCSTLTKMFSWDKLNSTGKEIIKDWFVDSSSRGLVLQQLKSFSETQSWGKDGKDAFNKGYDIMKAIYDTLNKLN